MPDTWYASTQSEMPQRDVLSANTQVEVCVVGAGLAGLTTTLELSRAGVRVALLEAKRVAWGASGRNAGFVAPGFAENTDSIIARCGKAQATRLYHYSQLGADYVRNKIDASDPAVKTGDGVLEVSRVEDKTVDQRVVERFNRHFSESHEYWTREKTQALLISDKYQHAVFDPKGFHINPLRYAQLLATEIEQFGTPIYEKSPALKLEFQQDNFRITTPNAQLTAKQIVLCTSAYDSALFPSLSRAILPVATHVVVTEPLNHSRNPIHTTAAVADTRRAGDYYRLVDDNRLLWGGKITTRATPPQNLDITMRKTLSDVFPSLDKVKIDYRWSGLMGYCIHKMPLIGEIQPGIWAATAFGGHGLNTTAMAGLLVSSAICEGDTRWHDFSAYPPRWAGGLLGRTGVQLSYWGMQLRDWWDER